MLIVFHALHLASSGEWSSSSVPLGSDNLGARVFMLTYYTACCHHCASWRIGGTLLLFSSFCLGDQIINFLFQKIKLFIHILKSGHDGFAHDGNARMLRNEFHHVNGESECWDTSAEKNARALLGDYYCLTISDTKSLVKLLESLFSSWPNDWVGKSMVGCGLERRASLINVMDVWRDFAVGMSLVGFLSHGFLQIFQ